MVVKIRENNPFTKIDKPLKKTPEGLKRKVVKDIAFAKILMELANLFSLSSEDITERTIEQRHHKTKEK